ncbi:MAG: hypothetical protein K8M05_02155 [Deltaproteobacteria bacterium]|nr:hypothetical protein [Kofleriaceae bacterium]
MADRQDNLAVRVLAPALTGGRLDAVALREGERAWTYRELADKVSRMRIATRSRRRAPSSA